MNTINLATLSWQHWMKIIIALVIYLGPGMALSIGYSQRQRIDKTQAFIIAVGTAFSGWTVLYAWLNIINISLSATSIIAISCVSWIYFLYRTLRSKPTHTSNEDSLGALIKSMMFWGLIFSIVGIFLWLFKDFVAGLGSDSYHHTLIAQLILEQGQLPDNYLPYAPLVTFRYHFGYHAFVATLSMLSGIEPRLMVLISGPLFLGLAALSTGFFAECICGDRLAGVIAAAITGLVAVFPAYILNWARYTQLAGLALMPILLSVIWRWMKDGFPKCDIARVALFAAGLSLTHYRITLMATLGILSLLGYYLFHADKKQLKLRRILSVGTAAILVAAFLTLPWILHIVLSYILQEPSTVVVSTGTLNPGYFSIERIGLKAIHYPTNTPIIVVTMIAMILSLFTRRKFALPILAWTGIALLLSQPKFVGTRMDTVTIIISLYLPAAVIIAVGSVDFKQELRQSKLKWSFQALILITLVLLLFLGLRNSGELIEPSSAFVQPSDLEAASWIHENVPENALFMVNTARFGFTDRFIIGIDSGYWLPLLANRQTVTLPMTYGLEATNKPYFLDLLDKLDSLQDEIPNNEIINKIRSLGITHIYTGVRGGSISPEALIASDCCTLQHTVDKVYIFSIGKDSDIDENYNEYKQFSSQIFQKSDFTHSPITTTNEHARHVENK